MTGEAIRLTLVSSAPQAGGPDLAFGSDGPGTQSALDRIRQTVRLRSDRVRCVCSPARAAGETARALGYAAPSIDDDLQDRREGRWNGRSLTELAQAEPVLVARWLRDPDFAPPGGESARNIVARASAWLDGLGSAGPILAVTHPALIRAFVVVGLASPAETWFRIDMGHGTRTVLTRNGPTWRVALVNAPI